MAYRVFGCEGSTTSDIMLAAMEKVLDNHADVVNMSLGARSWPESPMAKGAERLVKHGDSDHQVRAALQHLLGARAILAPRRDELMKFLVSWSLPHATFRPAVARFLEGGGMPPAGIKLIGRRHGMSGKGCAVVDTDDAKALYAWVAEWSEFLPLETTPVVEDGDAGAVLGSLYK